MGIQIWEKTTESKMYTFTILCIYRNVKHIFDYYIGGIDFSEKESVQTLLDSRPIYMMAFDKDFNIIGRK